MRRQQEKEGGPGEEGGVAWGERVGGCGLSNCTLMTLGLYTGSEGTNVKEGGFGHNLGEWGGGGGAGTGGLKLIEHSLTICYECSKQ